MVTTPTLPRAATRRRVVLVDFDWADADLVPELLRLPDVQVRLMAGRSARDPGIRIAGLCGVPHTLDVEDLTRDAFDVALVGSGSPRRTRIRELLSAAGTAVLEPREFLADARQHELRSAPGTGTATELTDLAPEVVASIVDAAIPDLAPGDNGGEAGLLEGESAPPPDDQQGLELLLARAAQKSGAFAVAIRMRDESGDIWLAAEGPDDPLMLSLADLALRLDAAQVVHRIRGGAAARVWGAWPVRIGARRGVLMAAGLDTEAGAGIWEGLAVELTAAWERRAPADAEAICATNPPWHSTDEFQARIRRVIERNALDGQPFVLYRLRAEGPPGRIEAFCRDLALDLRSGDALCRIGPEALLVLSPGPASAFTRVLDRITDRWDRTCATEPGEPPALACERIELASREDGPLFRAIAEGWLRTD